MGRLLSVGRDMYTENIQSKGEEFFPVAVGV